MQPEILMWDPLLTRNLVDEAAPVDLFSPRRPEPPAGKADGCGARPHCPNRTF